VTFAEFEIAVNETLTAVESDENIVATCRNVREALRARVPTGAKLDVYEHGNVFSVSADIGATRHRVVFSLG
jgi:hypothetical protein